jgi:hypothetical protein
MNASANRAAKPLALTTRDIEIAVARHFNYRANLIVPNVWWGWRLRHEADLLVVRPSGYCDEVEIKVSLSDIKADLKKRWSHWDDNRVLRVWFAVPEHLAGCEHIPAQAGVLSVSRRPKKQGTGWRDTITVVRPAKLRDKRCRQKISDRDRLKLAELGAMRIWDLKSALTTCNRRNAESCALGGTRSTPGQKGRTNGNS